MDKLARLTAVPEKFISELYRIQDKLFRAAIGFIKQLELKDGRIALNKKNLAILAEFEKWYRRAVSDSGFYDVLAEFINEFDTQAVITVEYMRKEFGNVVISELTKQVIETRKLMTAEAFISTIVDAEFRMAIKEQVVNATLGKNTFSDVMDTLQTTITGDDRIDGKLVQYSKQVAYDSFAIADRTYTHAISDAIGAEWFKYSGGVRDGTRPFCRGRFNKFFHKREVMAWAELDWQGKIEATNSISIFDYAGGYQCKHSILPVSVFSVPKEVINRNLNNGNYKPDNAERKILKI